MIIKTESQFVKDKMRIQQIGKNEDTADRVEGEYWFATLTLPPVSCTLFCAYLAQNV